MCFRACSVRSAVDRGSSAVLTPKLHISATIRAKRSPTARCRHMDPESQSSSSAAFHACTLQRLQHAAMACARASLTSSLSSCSFPPTCRITTIAYHQERFSLRNRAYKATMSQSPMSAKSIVFLLGLLYLQACTTVDATISTSAGFPQDVFAKPAFQVDFGRLGKDATTLPIKRNDALQILETQEASSFSSTSERATPPTASGLVGLSSSLAVPGQSESQSESSNDASSRTLFWTLQRSSPDAFQLCSIPDFTFTPADKHASRTASKSTSRSRQDLIRTAQNLLEPLKKMCLYHTLDWFTYSFCHGREIRQFRRLGAQTAAQRAFKKAGGGDAGEKRRLRPPRRSQPYSNLLRIQSSLLSSRSMDISK